MTITVDLGGKVSFIYDDALAGLLSEGRSDVRRASHVEPWPGGGWLADMAPVGGPKLGPFALRRDALDAEFAWIQENVLCG